jgi:hypothetical protein
MRRTKQREQYAAAEHRVWQEFRPKLAALQSIDDALRLVMEAPHHDAAPGRRYYSNLSFFAFHSPFTVPAGANATEIALYREFIARLDANGHLKLGAR